MGLRAHEMPHRFQAAGFRVNPAAFFLPKIPSQMGSAAAIFATAWMTLGIAEFCVIDWRGVRVRERFAVELTSHRDKLAFGG